MKRVNIEKLLEIIVNNQTTKEGIDKIYYTLRKLIRNYVQKILENEQAVESDPLKCDVSIADSYRIFNSGPLYIRSIFQDNDGSGMIWCNIEYHSEDPIDFDELSIDDQMIILKSICETYIIYFNENNRV